MLNTELWGVVRRRRLHERLAANMAWESGREEGWKEREGGRERGEEGRERGREGEREKGRGGERGWNGGKKERKRRERREKRKRGTGRERREENDTTIREKTRINENDDNNQSNFIHTYIPFCIKQSSLFCEHTIKYKQILYIFISLP